MVNADLQSLIVLPPERHGAHVELLVWTHVSRTCALAALARVIIKNKVGKLPSSSEECLSENYYKADRSPDNDPVPGSSCLAGWGSRPAPGSDSTLGCEGVEEVHVYHVYHAPQHVYHALRSGTADSQHNYSAYLAPPLGGAWRSVLCPLCSVRVRNIRCVVTRES